MKVVACSDKIPGCRINNSPAPSNNASQIDCGATPLFNSSIAFALVSTADPSRIAFSISNVASLLGFPLSQLDVISFTLSKLRR